VADHPGRTALHINRSDVLSSIVPEWIQRTGESGRFDGLSEWTDSIEVETVTLDALIKDHGVPAFCKVDVEGAEPQVFGGLSQPLPLVAFEFAAEAADRSLSCVAVLADLGATQFAFSSAETATLDDWVDVDTIRARLLGVAQDPRAWGDIYARASV
jgi:hypothetical protein